MDFNDDLIVQGKVTEEQIKNLEETLLKMYAEKAQKEGKTINTITKKELYESVKNNNEDYNLYTDSEGNVKDMTPVVTKLLDTEEGLFYAKIKLL